jgi:hypothetical protein
MRPSEEQAFAAFVRERGGGLLRFARRLIPDAGEAEDAAPVDGAPVSDPYLTSLRTRPFGPTVVPEEACFLLGDNRTNSNDSRQLGPVAADTIEGVAVEIVSTSGEHRAVPGAPERQGAGDADLVDLPNRVPPAESGPAGR